MYSASTATAWSSFDVRENAIHPHHAIMPMMRMAANSHSLVLVFIVVGTNLSSFLFLVLHKWQCLGLFHHQICQHAVVIVFTIDEVVERFQFITPTAVFQRIDQTEILQGYAGREDVEIGEGQLRECQLVGIIAVVLDEALHVTKGFHSKGFEYWQVGHR